MVLGWFPRFADRECARLTELWLRPVASCRTFDHGWVVYLGLSVFIPIGLCSINGSALCGTPVLEFRDHTGSPAIPDGECGVM